MQTHLASIAQELEFLASLCDMSMKQRVDPEFVCSTEDCSQTGGLNLELGQSLVKASLGLLMGGLRTLRASCGTNGLRHF